MANKVKGDVAVLELLRKGPATPTQVEKAQGHTYTSKMMWWLKACGYKIDVKKEKNRIVNFTLVSEKGAKPLVEKTKAAEKPVLAKAAKRAAKPAVAPAVKAPVAPKVAAKSDIQVPLADETIKAGNYTVDEEFDTSDVEDILAGIRAAS